MSRTRSVSDAWAVKAAKPMTNATAVGPAFRVRVTRLSALTDGLGSGPAGSCDGFSFSIARSRFMHRFVSSLSLFRETDRIRGENRQDPGSHYTLRGKERRIWAPDGKNLVFRPSSIDRLESRLQPVFS